MFRQAGANSELKECWFRRSSLAPGYEVLAIEVVLTILRDLVLGYSGLKSFSCHFRTVFTWRYAICDLVLCMQHESGRSLTVIEEMRNANHFAAIMCTHAHEFWVDASRDFDCNNGGK